MPTILTVVGLVLLCVNPDITQGHDNMNILLNTALCLSPAVLLLKSCRVLIPKVDIPFGCVVLCVMALPFFFHFETVRLSTMLFLCAYCVYIMMLARLVRVAKIDAATYCRVIRWTVYAYTFLLVIQQICVLMDWPVIMRSIPYQDPYKLNSLMAEPSQTTLVLGVLMYFYTQVLSAQSSGYGLHNSFKTTPLLWICYIWTIATTHNASAFVLGPLCLLPFINRGNWPRYLIAAVIVALGVWLIPDGKFLGMDRVRSFTTALPTLDESRMLKADTSISMRIIPTLHGAGMIDPGNRDTYVGHGVDAERRDTPEAPCGERRTGSTGFFNLWYNYGIPAALAFWIGIGILTLIKGRPITLLTFLLAMILSGDYNVQFIWMVLAFSMVYKYSICGRMRLLETVKKHG